MIDLSISYCIFKERSLYNDTVDYSLASCHLCTSPLSYNVMHVCVE